MAPALGGSSCMHTRSSGVGKRLIGGSRCAVWRAVAQTEACGPYGLRLVGALLVLCTVAPQFPCWDYAVLGDSVVDCPQCLRQHTSDKAQKLCSVLGLESVASVTFTGCDR